MYIFMLEELLFNMNWLKPFCSDIAVIMTCIFISLKSSQDVNFCLMSLLADRHIDGQIDRHTYTYVIAQVAELQ